MEYKMIGGKVLQLFVLGHILGIVSSQDARFSQIPYGGVLHNILGPQDFKQQDQNTHTSSAHRPVPANQAAAPDTRGREFIFHFISNFMKPSALLLLIGNSGRGTATVTISIARLNFNKQLSVNPGRREELNLPIAAVAVGTGPQNGTIWIKASHPVTVHGVNVLINTNEGFLAIPTTGLGTEYFVASYDPVPIEQSEFLISGIQSLTRVRIEPSAKLTYNKRLYNAGDPILLNLNRFQSVQFQSMGDLTGTKIKADKPISVMSGATCTLVPSQTYRCDHLVENIPPVHTWGKKFTLLPFLNRTSGYVFRMIAARPQTNVDVAGTSFVLEREGSFKQLDQIANFAVTITSNKPILVVQYAKGLETDNYGDPFMTVVPPIEQYVTGSVTFGTFDQSGADKIKSFISMSVTSPDLFNLNVNNRPAYSAGSGQDLGRLMSFGADRSMSLPKGANTISNPSPGSRFSAIIYGFASGTGYGMPAAYGLRRLLCTQINTVTGEPREYDCSGTNSPGSPSGPDTPQIPSNPGQPNRPGGGVVSWPTAVPNPAIPPKQSDERCYSLSILLLSIIAPSIIIFLIMLIIMCGLVYRKTKL